MAEPMADEGPRLRPTPTQEENDRAAMGEHILEREDEPPEPEPEPEPQPPPTPTPPLNTAAPVVSGTTEVDSVLSTTNGAWSNSPTSFAIIWRRGSTTIGGATNPTRPLTEADVGQMISTSITATNADGGASADSNAVGPIVEPEPDPPADAEPAPTRAARRR